MAKVVIGGKEYTVPELNFVALERSWPYIEETMASFDPLKGSSAGLCIIAAGLIEDEHFRQDDFFVNLDGPLNDDEVFDRVVYFLKKKLKASELKNVGACINEIIKEAGLEGDEGELLPAGRSASPSPETAPDTSSSLSPPELKEEAGIP